MHWLLTHLLMAQMPSSTYGVILTKVSSPMDGNIAGNILYRLSSCLSLHNFEVSEDCCWLMLLAWACIMLAQVLSMCCKF